MRALPSRRAFLALGAVPALPSAPILPAEGDAVPGLIDGFHRAREAQAELPALEARLRSLCEAVNAAQAAVHELEDRDGYWLDAIQATPARTREEAEAKVALADFLRTYDLDPGMRREFEAAALADLARFQARAAA
ncbi:hypothetical protein [Roseicella aquatilis]|uniref:Uncharacterized protein n=1 Tax=Roseicella aquatilis TaxID=2527868 RepID=A0A4R4DU42_9PROT|nr:hypothetical protein [Roseicella aquatilis]TCZ65562.1 hypothetical protein EXY23_05175 [Roseicella aquatilis]